MLQQQHFGWFYSKSSKIDQKLEGEDHVHDISLFPSKIFDILVALHMVHSLHHGCRWIYKNNTYSPTVCVNPIMVICSITSTVSTRIFVSLDLFMLSSNFCLWTKWQKYNSFGGFIFYFLAFDTPIVQYLGKSWSLASLQIMFNPLTPANCWFESSKDIVLLSFPPWTKIIGRYEQVSSLTF